MAEASERTQGGPLPIHRGAPPAPGSLLPRAGCRSVGASLSVVKNTFGWDTLGQMLFGFGAAGRQTRARKGHWASSEVRCTRHAEIGRSRCGCRSIVLRRALVTTRMQVEFLKGEGCGCCVFSSPVTKTDPQALGKKRTHACACSSSVGSESMCPVKVARKLYHGGDHCGPVGAHPIPAMRPLWPSAHVPEVGRVDGDGHQSRWARVPRLFQAFCRWGSRAVLENARDCHLSSATEVAAKVTKGL